MPKKVPTTKKPATLTPLNNKEEKFCVEYAASDNQVKSFMYVWPGYSYKAASVEARRLLENPLIIERINELKEKRREKLTPTVDKVLAELCKLSFYDPRDFFDDDGRLKPLGELDPDHAAVIAGIETIHKITGDDGDGVCITTKIKLPNKNEALEKLGKNLKLWKEAGSPENPLTVIHKVERVIVEPNAKNSTDPNS
jgi:phage terminase small subunit